MVGNWVNRRGSGVYFHTFGIETAGANRSAGLLGYRFQHDRG